MAVGGVAVWVGSCLLLLGVASSADLTSGQSIPRQRLGSQESCKSRCQQSKQSIDVYNCLKQLLFEKFQRIFEENSNRTSH